jgi:hypothetical protein
MLIGVHDVDGENRTMMVVKEEKEYMSSVAS